VKKVSPSQLAKSCSFTFVAPLQIAEVAYRAEDELGAVDEASEQISRQGMVVVIALASVAGACLAALAVLQMVRAMYCRLALARHLA